ncbi:hypothetical protein EVAR_68772_1 [Eumeta japonica]|uniref:Uncharacterized protein n=1 Tax=Eumeta variegata TaxID=151549 RepID=A0A4C1ZVY3_EUMVA|nr:hypothetical protein EVAR_68772_1 [Eumeta japonica]
MKAGQLGHVPSIRIDENQVNAVGGVELSIEAFPEEAETENISPPAGWNTVVSESGIFFEGFVTCDDGVMTAGTLSDDEIIDSVVQKNDTNDLDDIEDSG